jgi:hypothetical protein
MYTTRSLHVGLLDFFAKEIAIPSNRPTRKWQSTIRNNCSNADAKLLPKGKRHNLENLTKKFASIA